MNNFKYTLNATTIKNIPKFNSSLYSALEVNMLKYNHDSSTIVRMLSSFINTNDEILEDLHYQPALRMRDIDFTTIDRQNGFLRSSIPGYENGNILKGYSRYTNAWFTMKNIKKKQDFLRHSLPCGCFFSIAENTGEAIDITLNPYISEPIGIDLNNTQATIRPIGGFSLINKDDYDYPISILIKGIDTNLEYLEETIDIVINSDHITVNEFIKIESILLLNSVGSVDIKLYPFILGEKVLLKNNMKDRENLSESVIVATVNKDSNQLIFNSVRINQAEYPFELEIFKTVDIDIDINESIESYFLDQNNELLHITTTQQETNNSFIYCFPFIIPVTENNTLEGMKTERQALKIEYFEDCVGEKFVIFVFPALKENGIEFLNITINDEVFEEDIILDSIARNISTNRFEIPFSLLNNEDSVVVKFITYGDSGETIQPILLDRTKNKRLFKKQITIDESFFKIEPDNAELTLKPSYFTTKSKYPIMGAFSYGEDGYGENGYGGYQAPGIDKMFKISRSGCVYLRGAKIINIFNSFFYDELNDIIITSDTITHLAVE